MDDRSHAWRANVFSKLSCGIRKFLMLERTTRLAIEQEFQSDPASASIATSSLCENGSPASSRGLKAAAFALPRYTCFRRRYERVKTIRLDRRQRDHGKPNRGRLTNLKPRHDCGMPKPLNYTPLALARTLRAIAKRSKHLVLAARTTA